MRFKEYPEERLRIASICSRLTEDERVLRHAVMEGIINAGGPVTPSDMRDVVALDDERFAAAERGLDEKHFLVRGAGGEVNFAYPVSGLPTTHTVTLADGRSFHPMCAIDGLGSAFTLGQDIVLTSKCSRCGEPIRVEVTDGAVTSAVPATAHAVHADLNKDDNWAGSC